VTGSAKRVPSAYAGNRYGILFYSLLVSLAVSPVLKSFGFAGHVVELFLAVNLVAGVLAVGEDQLRRAALAALVVALATRPVAAWLGQHGLSKASLVVWGVVALLAMASALRFALRGQSVGHEQVHAALSAYLLAGFFFGLLYWVIEQFAPASLDPRGLSVNAAIYFSFVTLAALGYGDVLPLSDVARGLAVIEVVGGQLFLAVMVARLVGAWRS